jgi:hypothetical protein
MLSRIDAFCGALTGSGRHQGQMSTRTLSGMRANIFGASSWLL